MESWHRSNILRARMDTLVKHGLLQAKTEADEWVLPSDKGVPMLHDGYVVSFMPFHERGFTVPPPILSGTIALLWHRAAAPKP
jgi:hypothetical protein